MSEDQMGNKMDKVLDTLSDAILPDMLRRASAAYYNGGPEDDLISDDHYEQLVAILRQKNPTHPFLSEIGAPPPPSGSVVRLPCFMGSLSKVRPQDVMGWLSGVGHAEPFAIMPKFDGISCLVEYDLSGNMRAYTRGDGTNGQDITAFMRYLNPPSLMNVRIQGELICFKGIFERYFKGTSLGDGAPLTAPRNTVTGIIRRAVKDPVSMADKIPHLDFIAYGINKDSMMMDAQLTELMRWGFVTPLNIHHRDFQRQARIAAFVKSRQEAHRKAKEQGGKFPPAFPSYMVPMRAYREFNVFNEFLPHDLDSQLASALQRWKATLNVEIDGLVLTLRDREKFSRLGYNGKYPNGAVAVKLNPKDQDFAEARVGTIEYSLTGRGILKPVVVLENPVVLANASISRIYGDSARWVVDNKIGPGAVVNVIRSGDVIPRILNVVSPGRCELPSTCPSCGEQIHRYNSKRWIDIFCTNPACHGHALAQVLDFFTALKADNIGEGTLRGLLPPPDTFPALDGDVDLFTRYLRFLYSLSPDEIMARDGFAQKSAEKLVAEMMRCTRVPLYKIFAASPYFSSPRFGIGELRMREIMDALDECRVSGEDTERARSILLHVNGIGADTATAFLSRFPVATAWLHFMRSNFPGFADYQDSASGVLSNYRFVFTNFRDNALTAEIEGHGGSVGGFNNKKINVLIYAEASGTKWERAKERGYTTVPRADISHYLQNLIAANVR